MAWRAVYLFYFWKQISHSFMLLIGSLFPEQLYLFSYSHILLNKWVLLPFCSFHFVRTILKIFGYSQSRANSMRSPQIHFPNPPIHLGFVTLALSVSFHSLFFLKHFILFYFILSSWSILKQIPGITLFQPTDFNMYL